MEKHYDVIVIGGGATGSGILRDLSLRGIKCLLVEKSGLADGTSGRFHGLLHSGARYAVADPASAIECAQENALLKKLAPGIVVDTGGYFVALEEDDDSYIDRWQKCCTEAGIEVKEIPRQKALVDEPLLNQRVKRVFQVPDATIDGFKLVDANSRAAIAAGARVKTHTAVAGFKVKNGTVKGVYLNNLIKGQQELVECSLVINAAGAWADRVAAFAGLNINIAHDHGVLLVFNHRVCQRVINRLRPPGNGDIIVPHGSVTILGTTSQIVEDPDYSEVDQEHVQMLLNEGEQVIPGLKGRRLVRAFAGIRPIYTGNYGNGECGRKATRDFTVIDHQIDDGLDGIVSVVGGKFTIYRLMAQAAADLACSKLGINKESGTNSIPLQAVDLDNHASSNYYLCQCEKVTPEMLLKAVEGKEYFTLNDVRRLTRLGMGPCQGTFCTYRAAGFFHEHKKFTGPEAINFLNDDVQERWKGNRAVLWANQAQEAEIARGIYLGTLDLGQVAK